MGDSVAGGDLVRVDDRKLGVDQALLRRERQLLLGCVEPQRLQCRKSHTRTRRTTSGGQKGYPTLDRLVLLELLLGVRQLHVCEVQSRDLPLHRTAQLHHHSVVVHREHSPL